MKTIAMIFLLGILATLFMDFWSLLMKHLFNINGLDYRFVGRWVYYMKDGVFSHKSIFDSKPAPMEVLLGWIAHYSIGVTFSFALIIVYGKQWLLSPSFLPALIVGLITVVAPFFIMQPAFGLGVAGSNTPSPNILRLKSLMAHSSYGVGIYLSGLILTHFSKYIN